MDNLKHSLEELTLAIHSTDNSFGFAYRKNNNFESDIFFIKKFDNDLCNNLVVDFKGFISKENLQKVKKISVSIGPANFNASRMTVVLARTLSQQINCPLNGFSSFELMSKRIAKNNNFLKENNSFWIYKKLKRKGFIAGKYEILVPKNETEKLITVEKIIPNLIQELNSKEYNFQANFNDKEDLRELLNLSNQNMKTTKYDYWDKVVPIYPLSPTN